jgi:hypothetical protein
MMGMVWLLLSFSVYPLGWLAMARWMSKNERKVIEWGEKGFSAKYAMDIERIKDWPLSLWLFGYPMVLGIAAGSFVNDSFLTAFMGIAFFVGHLLLGQELSYFVAAREELEARKRREKAAKQPAITS